MSLMPVFSAAATTLSKGVRLMTEVPFSHNWRTLAVSPAPSPPYWGKPPGTNVLFLSLNPQVRKTERPASLAAVRPASTSEAFCDCC